MATSRELKAEISQLMAEAEPKASKPRRPRKRKAAEKPKVEEPAQATETPAEDVSDDLTVLADKLSEFVDNAEHEIKERPVTMVLGAFALGVIVGAVLRR